MCLAQGPQRSDAGEARTRGLLVLSQALYHCGTAFPRRVVLSYKRKYVHKVLVNCLFRLAQESVVRGTDSPAMTIAVDLGRKATKNDSPGFYWNSITGLKH